MKILLVGVLMLSLLSAASCNQRELDQCQRRNMKLEEDAAQREGVIKTLVDRNKRSLSEIEKLKSEIVTVQAQALENQQKDREALEKALKAQINNSQQETEAKSKE